jgi:hypothetical protein
MLWLANHVYEKKLFILYIILFIYLMLKRATTISYLRLHQNAGVNVRPFNRTR